jgi:hypothetical protein
VKYLLSPYYVPGAVIDAGDTAENKSDKKRVVAVGKTKQKR